MAVILWLLVAGLNTVVAQTSSRGRSRSSDEWYIGYNGFRMLLEERGLTTRVDMEQTLSTPSESVVVLLGDLQSISRTEWLRLRRFVAQGGCLLVASEQSFTLPGVSAFSPGPALALDAADHYKGFSDCIVLPMLLPDHPLSFGVREIVVNRSGWLSAPQDDSLNWNVIASLPTNCLPGSARGKAVLLAGLDPEPDRGVMILSADKSIFSDGMLWRGDNSILAIQTSLLLCRGQRRWLTVFEDGRTLPSYRLSESVPPSVPAPGQLPQNLPDIPPPKPGLETTLKIVNLAIDEVQKSNLLNETIRQRPRNVNPVAWLRTMLLVFLILFTLVILWRLAQSRWHLLPNRHSRFLQSMYGVHSSKQIESSEFGTAVEVLSRDLCREITGSNVQADWIRVLGTKRDFGAALPGSLRKGLSELLEFATRGCKVHISRRKFQHIGRTIQEIRNRHRTKPLAKC